MKGLYEYKGTVSSISYHKAPGAIVGGADLVLHEMFNDEKAPIKIEAVGGIAEYVRNIENTDAEERYIDSTWCYDENLMLQRIEVPGDKEGTPAKVITNDGFLSDDIQIFGPQDFIDEPNPESMSRDEMIRMFHFADDHEDIWYR